MLSVVITIFSFAIGIFVAAQLFNPIVKTTILAIYRSIKKSGPALSEKEILKRTVQKRYMLALKDCPREKIIGAIESGAISNIGELVPQMIEAEKNYYKQRFAPFLKK